MNRIIKKVAVLGSGVMGSRIACHFANVGVQVLLLDILPKEPDDKEKAKGLNLKDKAVRNRVASEHLQNALKSNPSPIYKSEFARRIEVGNFEDDLQRIAECDWVIEAIVERLDIKKEMFEKVDELRKEDSFVSSNTSGIPIHLIADGRSSNFRKYFCGTHFFNPPRYLELLEIIPTADTDQEVVDFLMNYGDVYLGKTTVLAKDTPAFIANRIGVFASMDIFHVVQELGLSIEDVDKLTGPVIGHPKSATFRTADVVGLDTFIHVANGLAESAKDDERRDIFRLPDFLSKMQEKEWLGSKTGQGFYKKIKDDKGNSKILSLDFESMEYTEKSKSDFPTLEQTKSIDKVKDRFKVLIEGKDKAGEFYRKTYASLFAYVSNRIPGIADDLYRIDEALRAGFGWKHGPFEVWDAIGVSRGLELIGAEGHKAASWVKEMLDSGQESFYELKDEVLHYYSVANKEMKEVPGIRELIILDHIRDTKTIWKNEECNIIDLGDGIINVEFRSKANSLGGGVLEGINKGIEIAEKGYRGVVIANQADNFSVGANLGMIFMMAIEQEYEELNFAVKHFQDTMMRVRYSSVPVVVAPFNKTLGGGCEMTLHADAVQAHAEAYIGLVEFGVGLIPGGGGTKEMTRKASARYVKDDIEINAYRENLLKIGQAKVSTSAEEAFDLGYLVRGRDLVTMNKRRLIADAKARAVSIAEAGYRMPVKEKNIKVLGKQILGAFIVGANQMWEGHYISEYDKQMVNSLGYVMAGGDLSDSTEVSEQYLLDMEREAFIKLCSQKKTLERIQHLLKTGKPLRN